MARRRSRRGRSRYWIQRAIKRPGSLKNWMLRHRAEIKRLTGYDPFTRDGDIRMAVLKKLKNDKQLLKRLAGSHATTILRKINLAITLRKLSKRR